MDRSKKFALCMKSVFRSSTKYDSIKSMSFRKKLISCIALTPIVSLMVFLIILAQRYVSDQAAYLQEFQVEILEARQTRLSALFNGLQAPTETAEWGTSPVLDRACLSYVGLSWVAKGNDFQYIYCPPDKNKQPITLIPTQEIQQALSTNGFMTLYVVTPGGHIVGSEDSSTLSRHLDQLLKGVDPTTWSELGGASFESISVDKNEDVITSFQKINETNLFLVAITPKNLALNAVTPFLLKGLFAIILLTVGAVFTGVFLSHSLTRKIFALLEALKDVGKGDLQKKLDVEGDDEIDRLFLGFNKMSDEISDLMKDREEKVEIETRLNTASDLQKSFLPPEQISRPGLEIRSILTQAESIGGDWWSFFEKDSYYYVMVADVTGHGLKSALVTSAAKATLSHIDDQLEVDQIMGAFNRSVFDVTQGALQMTAVLVRFDKDFSKLSYCNASHEAPIYFLEGNQQEHFLLEVSGPRLGQKRTYSYKKFEENISDSFKMLLYSDGLVDLQNDSGRNFGDSRLRRLLRKIAPDDTLDNSFSALNRKIADFKGSQPLDDDLTYVYLQATQMKSAPADQ